MYNPFTYTPDFFVQRRRLKSTLRADPAGL
jgi:hypothetical protein